MRNERWLSRLSLLEIGLGLRRPLRRVLGAKAALLELLSSDPRIVRASPRSAFNLDMGSVVRHEGFSFRGYMR